MSAPIGLFSSAANFQVPSTGLIFKLVMTGLNAGQPYVINQQQNSATSFIPQGVIIDARGVSQYTTVIIGQNSQFQFDIAPGSYQSFMIPAYDIPTVTVIGMNNTDTIIMQFTNFPIVPQIYNAGINNALGNVIIANEPTNPIAVSGTVEVNSGRGYPLYAVIINDNTGPVPVLSSASPITNFMSIPGASSFAQINARKIFFTAGNYGSGVVAVQVNVGPFSIQCYLPANSSTNIMLHDSDSVTVPISSVSYTATPNFYPITIIGE